MPGKWEKLPAKRERGLTKQQLNVIDKFFGAANFSKAKALRLAGYGSPNSYLRFFQNPRVEAEIERRHAEVRRKFDVNYDRVVEEIARIAFANVLDYGELQPDGTIVIDMSHCDAAQMAAIGEIQVEEYTEGDGKDARVVKRVKLKPWNKLTALDQLMRHAGLSKDKATSAVADLADRISRGMNRAGARPNADLDPMGRGAGSREPTVIEGGE